MRSVLRFNTFSLGRTPARLSYRGYRPWPLRSDRQGQTAGIVVGLVAFGNRVQRIDARPDVVPAAGGRRAHGERDVRHLARSDRAAVTAHLLAGVVVARLVAA